MSHKKIISTIVYSLCLLLFTGYVFLDTFVIARVYTPVQTTDAAQTEAASDSSQSASAATVPDAGTGSSGASAETLSAGTTQAAATPAATEEAAAAATAAPVTVTGNSYSDGNITITISEYREYDTSIYVADIQLASAEYLQTALAQSAYGRNITETTSAIADETNAILAINGDYYGSQESGYVIRNGVLYRDTASAGQTDLVIYADGSFAFVTEGTVSAEQLLADGAQQVLSFGPELISNGSVTVSQSEEVGKAKASNPRTAIGVIDGLHYVFVVSDGRTSESAGLSLYELATFLQSLGVTSAYNLDGGGSSTMVFNGTVVNNPTTNGKTITERKVSDIVCIGY